MKHIVWAALAAAAAVSATPAANAEARYGGWERLGSREVGFARDFDVIHVGRYEGNFDKIRLKVERNSVFMNYLGVIYSNGGRDRIPIAGWIPRGGYSRVIDLRGGQRHIRQVELYYRSVPNDRRKARVEVWARH